MAKLPFNEAINHPSWKINDSIDMIKHHAKKLQEAGAITGDERLAILMALPAHHETPEMD